MQLSEFSNSLPFFYPVFSPSLIQNFFLPFYHATTSAAPVCLLISFPNVKSALHLFAIVESPLIGEGGGISQLDFLVTNPSQLELHSFGLN